MAKKASRNKRGKKKIDRSPEMTDEKVITLDELARIVGAKTNPPSEKPGILRSVLEIALVPLCVVALGFWATHILNEAVLELSDQQHAAVVELSNQQHEGDVILSDQQHERSADLRKLQWALDILSIQPDSNSVMVIREHAGKIAFPKKSDGELRLAAIAGDVVNNRVLTGAIDWEDLESKFATDVPFRSLTKSILLDIQLSIADGLTSVPVYYGYNFGSYENGYMRDPASTLALRYFFRGYRIAPGDVARYRRNRDPAEVVRIDERHKKVAEFEGLALLPPPEK